MAAVVPAGRPVTTALYCGYGVSARASVKLSGNSRERLAEPACCTAGCRWRTWFEQIPAAAVKMFRLAGSPLRSVWS